MPSGDDIKAGRGTSASNPTALMASKDDDGNTGFIIPCGVFEAGPTDEDSDVPLDPFAGVLGRGSHGHHKDSTIDMEPMPGALGFGGMPSSRQGGAGLEGIGGSANYSYTVPATAQSPGPGVVGVGGFNDVTPGAFGAGVIGLSGLRAPDSSLPTLPPAATTANAGVFGSSVVGTGVVGTGATAGVFGSSAVGTGIVGTGATAGVTGTSTAAAGAPFAGVVATGSAVPGLVATSGGAPAIVGASGKDRGGVFGAVSPKSTPPVAQIRLVPHTPVPVLSTASLPVAGQRGDLFARDVILGERTNLQIDCELWFCIREPRGGKNALWGKIDFADTAYA